MHDAQILDMFRESWAEGLVFWDWKTQNLQGGTPSMGHWGLCETPMPASPAFPFLLLDLCKQFCFAMCSTSANPALQPESRATDPPDLGLEPPKVWANINLFSFFNCLRYCITRTRGWHMCTYVCPRTKHLIIQSIFDGFYYFFLVILAWPIFAIISFPI